MIKEKLVIANSDLEEIYIGSKQWLQKLQGKTIFLTGGSGFFGKWILSSVIYANKNLDQEIKVLSITRNKEKFKRDFPEIVENSNITFFEGDLLSLDSINTKVDIFLHCAANVVTSNYSHDRKKYIEDELQNTKSVLNYCKRSDIKRLVYTSSGAVYGSVTNLLPDLTENFQPQTELTPYGEAKRLSEELISKYCLESDIEFNIARCFAFLGGYIPLEGSFAAGNFLKNILNGESIIINSDGQALRSFMYMTDLCSSLLNLCSNDLHGRTINLGSDNSVSIKELADEIARTSKDSKVEIKNTEKDPIFNKYIPNIDLARELFNIQCNVTFEEAVKRTLLFYKGGKY